jgi:hypothetical protein
MLSDFPKLALGEPDAATRGRNGGEGGPIDLNAFRGDAAAFAAFASGGPAS